MDTTSGWAGSSAAARAEGLLIARQALHRAQVRHRGPPGIVWLQWTGCEWRWRFEFLRMQLRPVSGRWSACRALCCLPQTRAVTQGGHWGERGGTSAVAEAAEASWQQREEPLSRACADCYRLIGVDVCCACVISNRTSERECVSEQCRAAQQGAQPLTGCHAERIASHRSGWCARLSLCLDVHRLLLVAALHYRSPWLQRGRLCVLQVVALPSQRMTNR